MTADPSEFLGLLDAADAAAGDAKPEQWARVVEGNPVNGLFWLRLAQARRVGLDIAGTITALEHALALGVRNPAPVAFAIAECHGECGDQTAALRWLEEAFALGFRDVPRARTSSALAILHSDQTFRRLVGQVDEPSPGREQRWSFDLDFLDSEIRRKSRFVLGRRSLDDVSADLQAIRTHLTEWRDDDVYAALIRLAASLGDGHSAFEPPGTEQRFRNTLPLKFGWFEEGLFVVAANVAIRSLVGGRVTAVDGHPVEQLVDALTPYTSHDNEPGLLEAVTYRLREPALLHAIGLARSDSELDVSVTTGAGPSGETKRVGATAEWPTTELSEAAPFPPGWDFAPGMAGQTLARWLGRAGEAYWFEHLPDSRAIYFQFNSVNDQLAPIVRSDGLPPDGAPVAGWGESLEDFASRLFQRCRQPDVERLVIDLRWNTGGNTYLTMPLLRGVIASEMLNESGRLVVITGRRTFSAAQNFATLLERFATPVFVGEPTGSSPNFVGESTRVQLPYNGATVTISDVFHQTSWPTDRRSTIAPHVHVPSRYPDFAANRDPALDTALNLPIATAGILTRIAEMPASRSQETDVARG